MKRLIQLLAILLLSAASLTHPAMAADAPKSIVGQSGGGGSIFLPYIMNTDFSKYSVRVNVPYFSDNAATHFSEAAIFWFGRVTPSENYADIRFAYDNTKLWVYLSTFDQYLWYDPTPSVTDLTQYDSATLQINLKGNLGASLDSSSYRFDAAMSWWETDRSQYQVAYQWQNNQWIRVGLSLATVAGYDGFFNDNSKGTRGWAITFEVPFSSLGLSGRPADGAIWGISMTMHDRDSQAGPPLADKSWPANVNLNQPSSWAQLHFGLPNYGAIAGTQTGSALIRRQVSTSSEVPDAGVGGTTPYLCNDSALWTTWPNQNLGRERDFNIQNQSKITDWPCYSKYYVTFPLSAIPPNKTILSARLILHHTGSSGAPGEAFHSLIQVFTVSPDWNETTITWNNAPAAQENVSQAWVEVPITNNNWPKDAYSWDVTAAASRAYLSGLPLSLALYEADSDYHSGKYFSSSETGDYPEGWNINGRPALEVKWGDR